LIRLFNRSPYRDDWAGGMDLGFAVGRTVLFPGPSVTYVQKPEFRLLTTIRSLLSLAPSHSSYAALAPSSNLGPRRAAFEGAVFQNAPEPGGALAVLVRRSDSSARLTVNSILRRS